MNGEIFVVAYPKSGVTWLVHLLSDLLDSPQQDIDGGAVIGAWGVRDDGGYVIRKSHDSYSAAYRRKNIVLLVRDPRDVIVSTFYYLRYPNIDRAVDEVTYDYEAWLQSWQGEYTVLTQYRWLRNQTDAELYRIATTVTGAAQDMRKVGEAVDRQRFENMQIQLHDSHFMRKGIVGDWRNHLSDNQCQRVYSRLGGLMKGLGYELS